MKDFDFSPSNWVPFRDKKVIEKIRKIKMKDIDKHPNPNFKIRVVKDDMVEWLFVVDMFHRIKNAGDKGKKVVFILPNPNHGYIKLAYMVNKFGINCRHLYTFNMDEYADEDGNIAPETYPQGFLRSTKNYLYKNIRKELRPREEQIIGPSNDNIHVYGKMIEDIGGADACYSGPGWTGHLAFIEPDAPEFQGGLELWKKMGTRIVTLSPFTIAQNSLHGSFGMSGDIASIPPKAATIGPAEVIGSKYRMDIHSLNTAGTFVSWQRFMTRLVLHGPVTPKVPESILQTVPTDVIVSETAARDIEPLWDRGY